MSGAMQAPGPLELHGEPGEFWISGPNGSIVLAAGAFAKCGRAGDHYECGHVAATARLHLSKEYAHLFVAAPELLTAAALALDWMRANGALLRDMAPIEAAIANATSQQTNPTR